MIGIVGIALVNVAISMGYYLRISSVVFMREPAADAEIPPPGTLERMVLLVCALACLILGLSPQNALPGLYPLDVLRLADLAAASLF